jgi:hypothetical protein
MTGAAGRSDDKSEDEMFGVLHSAISHYPIAITLSVDPDTDKAYRDERSRIRELVQTKKPLLSKRLRLS